MAQGMASPGPAPMDNVTMKAYVVQFRLLMATWTTHFKSLDYVKDSTMDLLDKRVLRTIAEMTMKRTEGREYVGLDQKTWTDMLDVFHAASPSLEQRSYGSLDPLAAGYDGPSSNMIVANSLSLLKDLQRLDNLLAIARNLLTAGERVQNLAAQVGFDREVCAMINLCIKITARGYDGDGTAVDEDKWQGVINGFKKLLITCLQFLSNLVTRNERLKLMLWVELFDSYTEPLSSTTAEQQQTQQHAQPQTAQKPANGGLGGEWVRTALDEFKRQHDVPQDTRPLPNNQPRKVGKGIWSPYFFYATVERDTIRTALRQVMDTEPNPDDLLKEMKRRWEAMSDDQRMYWKKLSEEKANEYWQRTGEDPLTHDDLRGRPQPDRQVSPQPHDPGNRTEGPTSPDNDDQPPPNSHATQPSQAPQDIIASMESANDGRRKLHEGKVQLLKRLQAHGPPLSRDRQQTQVSPASPVESPISPQDSNEPPLDPEEEDEEEDELDEEEEEDEEESSEDEDYAIPGEDGRGLLTDVPLILGPNEIEVLPMVIMSGIVAPANELKPNFSESGKDDSEMVNMYTIRCHLLLAQENGRNLLRELLIFVAAWDLREEELYFKFMVKIMEAILVNGLMPFAYGAFKESKDIISPAQAVIMKLLTKIFHSRQGFVGAHNMPSNTAGEGTTDGHPNALLAKVTPLSPPIRYDIQIVHCLFSEFRQTIIPQICSLIFLQGQIRVGHAGLDDFPLNLWDMERMYEGVYQYLEFFAILTDHEMWKKYMADWEVVSELLTLLNELEVAIPKGRAQPFVAPPPPPPPPPTQQVPQLPPKAPSPQSNGPVPVAVERPYDVNSPGNGLGSATPSTQPAVSATTPSAPQADWAAQAQGNGSNSHLISHPSAPPTNPATPSPLHDEPADFEWRNLKKLSILVLSSLVWKNRRLQDQVREFGGITTILACCSPDEHNPYIREHAIMCLRFLLEGNQENVNLVRKLAHIHGSAGPGAAYHPGDIQIRGEQWGRKPVYLDVHKDDWLWAEAAGSPEIIDYPPHHIRNRQAESVARVRSMDTPAQAAAMRQHSRPEFTVPDEVLDANGYETFVDSRGQVGLRRKNNRSDPGGDRIISPQSRLQVFQPSRDRYGDRQLERAALQGGGLALGGPPEHLVRSRTPPATSSYDNMDISSAEGIRMPKEPPKKEPAKHVNPYEAHLPSVEDLGRKFSIKQLHDYQKIVEAVLSGKDVPSTSDLPIEIRQQLDNYLTHNVHKHLSNLNINNNHSSHHSSKSANGRSTSQSHKPQQDLSNIKWLADVPIPPLQTLSAALNNPEWTPELLQKAFNDSPDVAKLKKDILIEAMSMQAKLKGGDNLANRVLERMRSGEVFGEEWNWLMGDLGLNGSANGNSGGRTGKGKGRR